MYSCPRRKALAGKANVSSLGIEKSKHLLKDLSLPRYVGIKTCMLLSYATKDWDEAQGCKELPIPARDATPQLTEHRSPQWRIPLSRDA